jgi:hypothetical protein
MSRQISRSRSRLLRLEGGVETKSRNFDLDRRDYDFKSVKIFLTVKISFFFDEIENLDRDTIEKN